jgi:hypothetical protein
MNAEDRCISIDFKEIKDGFKFNLFANCVNKTYKFDIVNQHQMLNQHASILPANYSNTNYSNNSSLVSIRNGENQYQYQADNSLDLSKNFSNFR